MSTHAGTSRTAPAPPRAPFYVVFPEAECERIRLVGSRRQTAKRGTLDRRASTGETGQDVHIRGYAAECALAAFLGVRPSEAATPTGNSGVTLRAYGYRFAVRHNSRPSGDLRYMPGFAPALYGGVPDVDFHVLVTGELPVLSLVGFATSAMVAREAAQGGCRQEVTLPGRGPRWLVMQRDLLPMESLLARCRLAAPPAPVARAHAEHLASLAERHRPAEAAPVQATLDLFSSPVHLL